jgi:hypothetical protein
LPPTASSPTRLRPVRRTAAAALVAVLACGTAACSSSSSSPAASPSSALSVQPGATPSLVASTVVVANVAGNVRKAYRKRFQSHERSLEKQVGAAVDGWFDGAFIGVSYPRVNFPDAFSTFTSQAATEAHRQRGLMTNWPLRHRIRGVTTVERHVALDVLAPRGRTAGVTARFVLRFTTDGRKNSDNHDHVTLSGQLFLTRNPHGKWRIFGFDVAKGMK